MVKHIVLFKLKETLSPAEKADIMNFRCYRIFFNDTFQYFSLIN